jgi:hypothetical protein
MCGIVVRARRGLMVAMFVVVALVLSRVLLHPLVEASPSDQVAADSCTVFAVSGDDVAFLASNEDYAVHDSYWWTVPGQDGNYGVLYVGLDDLRPRGGINEEGLSFDATGLPDALLNRHFDKPRLKVHFPVVALRNCATVEETIALAQTYDWGRHMRYQVVFADATGDAVIISPGSDGELAFTRKGEDETFVVATNFNRANIYHGAYPCERYDTATSMLDALQANGVLSSELCGSVLQQVSQVDAEAYTLYSSIYDPVNKQIHLYYMRQYDHVATLEVSEALALGEVVHPMSDLFPRELVLRAESQVPVSSGYPWRTAATVVVLFMGAMAIGRIEICGRCRNASTCPLVSQPVASLSFPEHPSLAPLWRTVRQRQ